jgi:hypothetical protein
MQEAAKQLANGGSESPRRVDSVPDIPDGPGTYGDIVRGRGTEEASGGVGAGVSGGELGVGMDAEKDVEKDVEKDAEKKSMDSPQVTGVISASAIDPEFREYIKKWNENNTRRQILRYLCSPILILRR